MCQSANFIVTKENSDYNVFWGSDISESYKDILEKFNLKIWDNRSEFALICVKVTPPNCDYISPLPKWEYELNQTLLPSWYNTETTKVVENVVRKELEKWLKAKVVLPNQTRKVSGNTYITAAFGKVEAHGSSLVNAYDLSEISAFDSSQIKAYGNSRIMAYDNSEIFGYNSSFIEAFNFSKVNVYESSSVIQWGDKVKSLLYGPGAWLMDRTGVEPKIIIGKKGDKNEVAD